MENYDIKLSEEQLKKMCKFLGWNYYSGMASNEVQELIETVIDDLR